MLFHNTVFACASSVFTCTDCVCPVNMKVKEILPLPSLVLSADRVEQMTKTYNDMEVVTQLLVEVGFFLSPSLSLRSDNLTGLLTLNSATETWSWPPGLASPSCRGTTCCRSAMRPLRSSWRRPWTRSVSLVSLVSQVSLDRFLKMCTSWPTGAPAPARARQEGRAAADGGQRH